MQPPQHAFSHTAQQVAIRQRQSHPMASHDHQVIALLFSQFFDHHSHLLRALAENLVTLPVDVGLQMMSLGGGVVMWGRKAGRADD